MPHSPSLSETADLAPSRSRRGGRIRLIRRIVLFQVKLLADGFRDVVMSPLSIAAGAIGIFSSRDPEHAFDRLMGFGRDTDRWINLFDTHDEEAGTLDRVAGDIEEAVRRDYAAGGISAKGAERLAAIAAQLRARGGR